MNFLCLPNKCFCLRSLLLFSASIECMWVSIWRALCFDLITQKRTQSRRTNLNFMHPSLFLLASLNYILNKYRNRNQTFSVRFRILGSKSHFSCVCAKVNFGWSILRIQGWKDALMNCDNGSLTKNLCIVWNCILCSLKFNSMHGFE